MFLNNMSRQNTLFPSIFYFNISFHLDFGPGCASEKGWDYSFFCFLTFGFKSASLAPYIFQYKVLNSRQKKVKK